MSWKSRLLTLLIGGVIAGLFGGFIAMLFFSFSLQVFGIGFLVGFCAVIIIYLFLVLLTI